MNPVSIRIFICTEAVDMRRGFDGLALIACQQLEQDPRSSLKGRMRPRSRLG